MVTHKLYVSFDDVDTPFAERTWVDISDRLRGPEVEGGRDSELDDFEAVQALFPLDNRDRELDPLNTDSSHYPDVVPNRMLWYRIEVT